MNTFVATQWASLRQHFYATEKRCSIGFSNFVCLLYKDTLIVQCPQLEILEMPYRNGQLTTFDLAPRFGLLRNRKVALVNLSPLAFLSVSLPTCIQ